eukprot:5724521-Amphidinium_carterae.1
MRDAHPPLEDCSLMVWVLDTPSSSATLSCCGPDFQCSRQLCRPRLFSNHYRTRLSTCSNQRISAVVIRSGSGKEVDSQPLLCRRNGCAKM